MVTKNFRVWAWARRPSPTGPNVVAATVATMGGREGNDRRGQDRRYQKAREGRGERRLDRPGHRGLRAHGEEVPEGDRPLREAAGGRQGARVAPARALRGAGRFVAARGQALLVQAAPHREEGLRPARRGEGLRGLVLDRQEVREEEARGARRRARRPRGAGVPAARLAPGRVPGRLRAGQADFRVRGVVTRGHFLVVTFPHSNVGLAQVFWGETAECACQGLRDVFEFLGGVPLRAVFDNATEVGRRVGTEIRTSALFRRFAAHYGLDYSFTNPYSGNEKGSVENKVGTLRRNLFVPGPAGLGREGLQRAAARDVPGALGRQAALPQGRERVRALRGRPRRALAAARGAVRVRDVAHQEVRQAGLVQGGRRAPLLGGPRQRVARGRRRDGRLRRHGRRRRRRGRRRVYPRVGRRADRLRRPRAAA